MGTVLHDTVGLLHATMAIFNALVDRTPVLILGGAGPMDTAKRRPWIDWLHTASLQGNAIRDITKYDNQPSSVAAMPEAFARARAIALSEPAGPVYLALDAALQEEVLAEPVQLIDWTRHGPATPVGPEPVALARAATMLAEAKRPVIVAAYAGRDQRALTWLAELAEAVGAGVVDTNDRLNIRTTHPLNVSGTEALSAADLVLLVDVKDASKMLLTTDEDGGPARSVLADGCKVIDVGFNEGHVSAWAHDSGPALPMDLRVTADTSVALPLLLDEVRDHVRRDSGGRSDERARRRDELTQQHAARRASWLATAGRRADEVPVSPARLAQEVGAAIEDYDWVLTSGTADAWALRLWDFDEAYRHPGRPIGTGTQIGLSLGVALANRGTGRLVVDIQPDGDLLFDAAAPWIATAHDIPLLVVMFNNRAYYNDWEHQIRMAEHRGSDPDRAHVGVSIEAAAPDFATLVKAFGWYAEGPITDPNQIRAAVQRAAKKVMEDGQPALVDVVCAHR
jgi:benzoylformate decarboxylase/acetolactate synthase-1/2/3 large subunit